MAEKVVEWHHAALEALTSQAGLKKAREGTGGGGHGGELPVLCAV